MRNIKLIKALAVGTILLLVAIAFSPTISAHNDSIISKAFSIPEKENTVSITVQEYKPDGTMGKSVVKLSKIQAEKLRSELNNVKDFDIRLSIYKKYNLIPQNITSEKLRLGMEERARSIGPKIEQLQKSVTHYKGNNFGPFGHFCLNFKSRVYGFAMLGLRFFGGTSLITSFMNAFIFWFFLDTPFLLSKDLFQFHVSILGALGTYNGILSDSEVAGVFESSLIFGFVGYVVGNIPLPFVFLTDLCEYAGYAVASMGVCIIRGLPGNPLHISAQRNYFYD